MPTKSKDTHVDVPVEQKKTVIPEIFKDWNNRTEQSYRKHQFVNQIPETLCFQNKHFLKNIDADKYPEAIQREVTKIVRIKAPDYNSKTREHKEFVYWYENWYGRDWLNRTVAPVTDHVEGQYWEQESEPVYDREQLIGHNRVGQHEVFYIPFSKKAVEDIISKSTINKEQIKFLVKTPKMRNDEFTFEQFTQSTFDECVEMIMHQGGPHRYAYDQLKQKQKDAELLKQQKQYS